MKVLFQIWFTLFLFIATACVTESGTGVEFPSNGQLTPETLTEKAEARYSEYLIASDGDRFVAAEKTASYLKELPGIKEVTVRGSDTLFVIMDDGNELLLMLGKNRL